jgi:hypothetical protein
MACVAPIADGLDVVLLLFIRHFWLIRH